MWGLLLDCRQPAGRQTDGLCECRGRAERNSPGYAGAERSRRHARGSFALLYPCTAAALPHSCCSACACAGVHRGRQGAESGRLVSSDLQAPHLLAGWRESNRPCCWLPVRTRR